MLKIPQNQMTEPESHSAHLYDLYFLTCFINYYPFISVEKLHLYYLSCHFGNNF